MTYPKHMIDTAPQASRDAMQRLKDSAGLIPNLAAVMANSPALIDGFVTLREVYQKQASLSAQDREILGVANAAKNGCEWCVAFHSFVAGKLSVDPAVVADIRAGRAPKDTRATALVAFTNRLNEMRGAVTPADIEAFTGAGFTKEQALEVVVGQALSLMANYAGNFVEPELDAFLGEQAWKRTA
jgi:uncharacterized peroxidase-related enzyme